MEAFVALGAGGAGSGLGGLDVREPGGVVDAAADVRGAGDAIVSGFVVANPAKLEKEQRLNTYHAMPQLVKGHQSDRNP